MAKYFEEDIPMDDIDEQTPLISSEQQEYLEHETSFQYPDQHETESRVRQLANYLDEHIPFEHLGHRFRVQGKKLQFRKDGIWKDLTNYDGSFKEQSEIASILTNKK